MSGSQARTRLRNLAPTIATVSLLFGVQLHSFASEPLEEVAADLNFPRSTSAEILEFNVQQEQLDQPLSVSEIYSLAPTVGTSLPQYYYLSSTAAPTLHTFDSTSESGGGNHFGTAGGGIQVSESTLSLGGGVNRYQVDVVARNSMGTLEPWVNSSWAGFGLINWRLDVGSTLGGSDPIHLTFPTTIVDSGFTAFNSSGAAIGTFDLTVNTSTATSLSGVALMGLGGADIAGANLAGVRMFWDVTTPADLAVVQVDAADGAHLPGSVLQVVIGVANLGATASATGGFDVYASTDTTITSADRLLASFTVPVMDPDDSIVAPVTPTIPADLAIGEYYIGVILNYVDPDSTNQVDHDPVPVTVSDKPEIEIRPLVLDFAEQASDLTAETSDQEMEITPNERLQTALPQLMNIATTEGSVRVIVGFDAGSTQLDGLLPASARQSQRQAIKTRVSQLRAALSGLSFEENARFQFIPYLALTLSANALQRLANLPFVTSIEEDKLSSPTLASSNAVIGSPLAWAEGYDGEGQTVAILDTGVDKTHTWFTTGGNKVVAEACYSTTTSFSLSVCPGGVASSTAAGSGVNCSGAVSGCDHGTLVAGVVAGNDGVGPHYGVAPGADLISIQVFSQLNNQADCGALPAPCALTFTSNQISALERVYALRNTYDIAAVNMSIGAARFFTQAACDAASPGVKTAIDNLRSVGIATVVGVGNNGFKDSIGTPGCISSAVSVGNTTDADTIAPSSNIYPQIHLLAPGTAITSSVPGGSTGTFDGSSLSAPHVAGAWAVMKQINPAASVTQVLTSLQNTGTPVDDLRSGGIETDMPRINLDLAIGEPRTTFGIFNKGPAVLNISSISPQTSAPWISWSPQAPFAIQPGELKVVSVTVDYSLAPAGSSQVRLLINSNDPNESPYPAGVFIKVTPWDSLVIFKNGFE